LSNNNEEKGKFDHASILLPVKGRFSLFFMSLRHPNNRLENISVLYLPLFNSVAKK